MPTPTFKIAQNPSDSLFYVVGACGRGMYMPVSEGCSTRSEANERMRLIAASEESARAELFGSLAVHA